MNKKLLTVLATAMFAGALAVPAQAAENMDKHSDYELATWETTNDWRIVEAYSTLYGEPSASAYNQDSTVINTFAAGYNLNHADYRSSWGTYFYPSSKNHIILIEKDTVPTGGGIWTPNVVYSYDNTVKQNELSPYAKWAIDWLYDIAKTASNLPLPPIPWDLAKVPTGVDITPVANSSVQVQFKSDPTIMSVEYSISVQKPVKTGTYGINVRSKAEAGYYIQSLMGVMKSDPTEVMETKDGRVAPHPKPGVKVKEAKLGKEKKVKMKKGDFEYEKIDIENVPATEMVAEPDVLTWSKDGDISMINFGDISVTVSN